MVRKIAMGAIILIVLLIGYNLIVRIMDALRSGERLSQAADKVYQLEGKNKQLKQKLKEVQSGEFIEEQARNKLGLGKAGETVVIIPEEKLNLVMGASRSAQVRLPNPLGWLKVFWH